MRCWPVLLLLVSILVLSCGQREVDSKIYGEWAEVKKDRHTDDIEEEVIQDFTWEEEVPSDTQRLIFKRDGTALGGVNKDELYESTFTFAENSLVFINSPFNKNKYTVRRLDETYLVFTQKGDIWDWTYFLKKIQD